MRCGEDVHYCCHFRKKWVLDISVDPGCGSRIRCSIQALGKGARHPVPLCKLPGDMTGPLLPGSASVHGKCKTREHQILQQLYLGIFSRPSPTEPQEGRVVSVFLLPLCLPLSLFRPPPRDRYAHQAPPTLPGAPASPQLHGTPAPGAGPSLSPPPTSPAGKKGTAAPEGVEMAGTAWLTALPPGTHASHWVSSVSERHYPQPATQSLYSISRATSSHLGSLKDSIPKLIPRSQGSQL